MRSLPSMPQASPVRGAGGRCGGCEFAFSFRNFTIDYIVPRSKDGSDRYENLQLLCGDPEGRVDP